MSHAAVSRVLGWMLSIFAATMLAPALLSLGAGEIDTAAGFALSAGAALFIGVLLLVTGRGRGGAIGRAEALVLAVTGWLVLGLFGALPFVFGSTATSLTDGFFESLSGLTTTGLSIFPAPENLDSGLLLWRAMTQWMGGMATIVFAITILPTLGIGGIEILRGDATQRVSDTLRPRLRQTARALWMLYAFLTALCGAALWIAGMPAFDALCHAMSTLSTGGFSTRADSVAGFDNAAVELILVVFMVAAAMNFTLHWRAIQGRPGHYGDDPECRFLLGIVLFATVATAGVLIVGDRIMPLEALRKGVFAVVSAVTTTGYVGPTIPMAPTFVVFLLLALAMVGGASGSTAGGLKLMRGVLLLRQGGREMVRLTRPHGVIPVKYGGASVPAPMIQAVWGFFAAYIFCLVLLASGLSAFGLDFPAALTAATSGLSNTGPVLGAVGGHGATYAALPDGAKWLLALGMLIGRLELLTLLVLLSPIFWRR